jgi:hypothetical protein
VGAERLELDRPASELVEEALSKVLTEAGYRLSRDANLIYRVTVSDFSASIGAYLFGDSHAISKLILDIEIEREGSIISRRQAIGHADLPLPLNVPTNPLQWIMCWVSCVPGWHLFGVPGIDDATRIAFSEALDDAIGDRELELALDPYAVSRLAKTDTERRSSPYRRRVAVVIGISDYWLWPGRENSLVDAGRVARTLREGGFDEVIELYDARATRRAILELLGADLLGRTTADDLVLIYFAGHGATESLSNGRTRGYIIPVDADTRWIYSTAISMAELSELSDRLPARHIYFSIASCLSGVEFALAVPSSGDLASYKARIRSSRSVQMITAGREGETAIVGSGKGIFTSFWIRGMLGEADVDGDGYVTGSELGEYVSFRVGLASGHRQSPQSGRLRGWGEPLFPVH